MRKFTVIGVGLFLLGVFHPYPANTLGQEPAVIRPELVVQTGHRGKVTCAAMTPDGKWLVTGGDDATARLWEVATGREVREFKAGKVDTIIGRGFAANPERTVHAVAISTDGKQVLTCAGKLAKVWDSATGKANGRR